MGREIKRVPLDFDCPVGQSFYRRAREKHRVGCRLSDDKCSLKCTFDSNPPKGPGWQLWQTVSDGPISPVFASAEALIAWMCEPQTDDPYQGPYPEFPWAQGWKRAVAEPFVRAEGWAPSGAS